MAEIRRGLHDGRYVPGQKLTEADLTRKYGVGRGSIREALRKLESEGLVMTSLHRGARIRIFSRDGARDVLEVDENLACLAARLAAERLGQTKDADTLRNVLGEMAEQLKRGESYETARLRYSFLSEVASLSNNQELQHLMPRSHVSVLRAQFRNVFDLGFAKEDLEHLKLLVDAILARDPERAEQAMRRYSRRFGIAIQQSPDTYFAE
ncbi:MAG TPA: GntR family transcriptional regulator [Paraburkholderia sp.]|uniref:GntR family transcriptional regulator n=1 Tax=Paraburkholderia sp. TaxID=1926495 RepID=UPI002B462178|nr:GntR family transcriptional regulator [Paraburkholderia sp.]HKR46933.1 GntR family transcriptional regulator [Paraburkholderia sp.]